MFFSILCQYYIENVKDGVHIQVYMVNKESVTHVNQFISAKVAKILRKSQAQVREKLRKRGSGKIMVFL